jgi:hypothetical protein
MKDLYNRMSAARAGPHDDTIRHGESEPRQLVLIEAPKHRGGGGGGWRWTINGRSSCVGRMISTLTVPAIVMNLRWDVLAWYRQRPGPRDDQRSPGPLDEINLRRGWSDQW